MAANRPFEINKNIIDVFWNYDYEQNDTTISDDEEYDTIHSEDGLYIYEDKNNEMKEIKYFSKKSSNYHSLIYIKNSLIIKYSEKDIEKISTLDITNLEFINNLNISIDKSLNWEISPFNSNFFIMIIWEENKSIKFKIYENRTLKNVYESESFQKTNMTKNSDKYYLKNSLYKLNHNEYLFRNFFINIEYNKKNKE